MPNQLAHSHRRGFTLVELLVVVAIIAVLVSLLLPALNKAKNAANTLTCLAQLRSIGQGLVLYQHNNGDYYPMANGKTTSPTYNLNWGTTTAKYMGVRTQTLEAFDANNNRSMPMFRCPSRSIEPTSATSVPSWNTYSGHVLVFGNNYLGWQSWGSYNPSIYAIAGSPLSHSAPTVFAYKAAWMRKASEKAIVFDGPQVLYQPTGNGWVQPAAMDMCLTTTNQAVWYTTSYMEDTRWWNGTLNPGLPAVNPQALVDDNNQDFRPGWPRFRHGNNDQCNFLFGDGHAETIRVNPKTKVMDLKVSNFLVHFPLF